jgi:hypothetical protein
MDDKSEGRQTKFNRSRNSKASGQLPIVLEI